MGKIIINATLTTLQPVAIKLPDVDGYPTMTQGVDSDGKPMWNVFQPKFKTGYATFDADALQAAHLHGPTSPRPGPNTNTVVGTARLDFTTYEPSETGKITYTYNGTQKLTRTIQRFKL